MHYFWFKKCHKEHTEIYSTVKFTFNQQPGNDQTPSNVLHVNSSRANPFFSYRSIQVHIWTCETEMFLAQFTDQIMCNIVSAGSRAFWCSVFGFGTVARVCVHVMQHSQDIVKSLLTKGGGR